LPRRGSSRGATRGGGWHAAGLIRRWGCILIVTDVMPAATLAG
jgi:hypothetical protein